MSWLSNLFGGNKSSSSSSSNNTNDAAIQAALDQQNAIADSGLQEQKKNDADLLAIAQTNAKTQSDAYAQQTQVASDAQAQQHADNLLSLQQAKDSAAANAATMQAQMAAADRTFQLQSAQYDTEQQNMNRLNQKAPDVMSIIAQNAQQARSGQSSTMLTGPGGVDTSKLLLGKSTVLGS